MRSLMLFEQRALEDCLSWLLTLRMLPNGVDAELVRSLLDEIRRANKVTIE